MIDKQLRGFIQDHPYLSDALGERVYPGGKLPMADGAITAELPAVTLLEVSDVTDQTSTDGAGNYTRFRYQIETYALTLEEAIRVSRVMHFVINGHRGGMRNLRVGGVFAQPSGRPEWLPDLEVWRVMRDYVIHVTNFNETRV